MPPFLQLPSLPGSPGVRGVIFVFECYLFCQHLHPTPHPAPCHGEFSPDQCNLAPLPTRPASSPPQMQPTASPARMQSRVGEQSRWGAPSRGDGSSPVAGAHAQHLFAQLKFKSLKLTTNAALQRRFGSPFVFREEDPSRQVSPPGQGGHPRTPQRPGCSTSRYGRSQAAPVPASQDFPGKTCTKSPPSSQGRGCSAPPPSPHPLHPLPTQLWHPAAYFDVFFPSR